MLYFLLAALMFVSSSNVQAQGGLNSYGAPPYGSPPVPDTATGRYWLSICENPSTNFRCVDLVHGLNSGHAQFADMYKTRSPYCAGNATLGTMTDVAVSYVRRNYNMAHYRFTDLVLLAWSEAWPCRY